MSVFIAIREYLDSSLYWTTLQNHFIYVWCGYVHLSAGAGRGQSCWIPSGARGTGGWGLPDVGSGAQMQVL